MRHPNLRTLAGKCAEPAEEALERATGCGPGGLEEPVRRLADMLGGDNGAISAWRILHLYLQRLGCDFGLQARAAGRGPPRRPSSCVHPHTDILCRRPSRLGYPLGCAAVR